MYFLLWAAKWAARQIAKYLAIAMWTGFHLGSSHPASRNISRRGEAHSIQTSLWRCHSCHSCRWPWCSRGTPQRRRRRMETCWQAPAAWARRPLRFDVEDREEGPWTCWQILKWNHQFITITCSSLSSISPLLSSLQARIALWASICQPSSQTRVTPLKSVLPCTR